MSKLKLLVIDDEKAFAEFVADVAENMGFDAIQTDNPADLATLYHKDLNIIVLDLFMPNIDGIELLRFLTLRRSHASIVFMSGKDKSVLNSAQEIALELGMKVLGVLPKPFTVKQLEDVLNNYVHSTPRPIVDTFDPPSVSDIKLAIENNDFFMMYQPQINLATRKVIGVEALVRWNHSSRGMIPPDVFIPIAESNDLMKEISLFVAETAIKQQAEWVASGLDLQMSINISSKNLDDLLLPEKLALCTNDIGSMPQSIMIEVTGTALMPDIVSYMDILTRLKMKGFNLSIDDFGTGYSSLQQLIRAPFKELKIDQQFIKNLDTSDECKTITETSILLAHKLGIWVVAEGIESEAVWEILKELGCDQGQGYWMCKPMLPEEMLAWVEQWHQAD